MNDDLKIFKNGSDWLRVDFHLHTNSDKEFSYSGIDHEYINAYVNKLEDEKIKVAVITNHNKFDREEYKNIKKKAGKKEIFVLPGVELSVGDGANGIHTLIVFNPEEWLSNETDFINRFLTKTFAGKANFENSNGRSEANLLATIKNLDGFDKEYFIVMAHIEQNNGLCKELDGGRIIELGKDNCFKKAVLGFQKVRTEETIENLKKWLDNKLPAFVEGSDPKCIEEIGKGFKCYIKIGAYNFEAVKYALLDYKNRLAKEDQNILNGYIKDITFQGNKYNGTISLNHAMNNLIGIRGSGKSSILEVIRYALDIDLVKNNSEDINYKDNIVNAVLGSGGKIVTTLVDNNGRLYRSEKTLGDLNSKVYNENNELQIGLKPNAIVKKPIYYGQKDLSKIGDSGSTSILIDKLIGNTISGKKREIDDKSQQVVRLINDIKQIDSKVGLKSEFISKIAELDQKIQIFKDKEIDKKLEKQINFNKDISYLDGIENYEKKLIFNLDRFIKDFKGEFESFKNYKSIENNIEVVNAIKSLTEYESIFSTINVVLVKLTTEHNNFSTINKSLKVRYEELKEEFNKIKRDINLPNIQADDYVKYTREYDITKIKLSELEKISNKKISLKKQLDNNLAELQNLWHSEYEILKKEVDHVNESQPKTNVDGKDIPTIKIEIGYRDNKEDLISYLKENFRGCNIRQNNIESIAAHYPDLISLYYDLSKHDSFIETTLSENQIHAFKENFYSNIGAFLTYKVPDKFEIFYKGRPLKEHSLGQRASALIIFLLTLKDSDLVIIDQPEDDLDNQTIYKDVIKVLKTLKNSSQFIFATHNPNIPVLGDCEQLLVCDYKTDGIKITSGSIDDKRIRQYIVEIMEGGEEAFNNRKTIYELWTH